MTKTIEELAKQYAKYQTDEQGYGSMEEWKQDVAIYYDDAKSVLSWLFDKPLASRLTTEEKERVRKMYADILSRAAYYKSKMSKIDGPICITHHCNLLEFYVAQIKLLEHIFGADFFKEGE